LPDYDTISIVRHCRATALVLVAVSAMGLSGQTIDDDISALVRSARVYDEEGMRRAVTALARQGPACLRQVAELLSNENANVRWQALLTIDRLGVAPTWLPAPIIKASQDGDGDVRGAAILVLGKLFPQHPQTMARVQALLVDEQPLVRAHAAATAWKLNRNKQAVPALLNLASDRDWMAAEQARRYLVEVGPPTHTGLTKMLTQGGRNQQLAALRTLSAMKVVPTAALPRLSKLAHHRDSQLSLAALRCLVRQTDGWPIVTAAIRSDRPALKLRAVIAMADVRGSNRIATTRLLLPLLDDKNARFQLAAMKTLRSCALTDPATEARLDKSVARFLHDHRPDHRAAAVALAGQLRLPLTRAALRPMLQRETVDYIRREAQRIINSSR